MTGARDNPVYDLDRGTQTITDLFGPGSWGCRTMLEHSIWA